MLHEKGTCWSSGALHDPNQAVLAAVRTILDAHAAEVSGSRWRKLKTLAAGTSPAMSAMSGNLTFRCPFPQCSLLKAMCFDVPDNHLRTLFVRPFQFANPDA
jgi:hypothetical protein